MVKTFRFFALSFMLFMLVGCMNCYVRCPFTKPEIVDTYQCTQETFALSYVVMFPQVMSPGSADSFYVENLITVPVGCVCFVDVACECVIDTVLWPVDYWLKHKKAKPKVVAFFDRIYLLD